MSERSTIARPYARAVFDLALEESALDRWSDMLSLMGGIAEVPDMKNVIANPETDREAVLGIFFDVAGTRLDKQGRNFLRVLMQGRRAGLLPLIIETYEALRAEEENRCVARVLSARNLTPEQLKTVRTELERTLGRNVELDCAVDEGLIGGIVVRVGDRVIDGSALGRLEQMARDLS